MVAARRLLDELHHPFRDLIRSLNSFFFFRTVPSLLIFGPFSLSRTIIAMTFRLLLRQSARHRGDSWGHLNLSFVDYHFRICNNQSTTANALKERLEDPYILRSVFIIFPITLPSLFSFSAIGQYPSKGQSTLWQMHSFFHVNFWCFLHNTMRPWSSRNWKEQTRVWPVARKCNNWSCIRPSDHPGIALNDDMPHVCHRWGRRAELG